MQFTRRAGLAAIFALTITLTAAVLAQGTLIFAAEGSPPTFDPLGAGADSRINTPSINMYNALYQFIPGTSEVTPELATGFELSDDGLTYTFTIREGVLFHDGTELTAADVKYTADRMLALQIGTARSFGPLESVDLIDERTVAFNLSAPFPGMLLALPRLYILNAEVVQANERDGDWGQTWLQNNEAGSGPYQLVSFQPEQQFTMERFDDYFLGFHEGAADTVILRVIKEESTRRLALESGDIDIARIGSTDSFAALENVPGITRYLNPALIQLYIAMNVNNMHLANPLVREAMTLVYDYEGHVEFVRSGFGSVARGPLPPAITCFDDSIPHSQIDIERAKALMVEAGYPDGGFELSMAYQGTSPEETAAFQIMQAGAAQLGITVRALPVEWPAKVELFSSAETAPDLGTIWEYPNYPDPDVYLFEKMHSSRTGEGGLNFSFHSTPEADALLEAAQVELDPAARCEIYRELQQIFLTENPYLNISVGTELAAAHDYVENYLYTASHAFTFYAYPISIANKP